MQLSPLSLKGHFVTNLSIKSGVPNFSSVEEAEKALSGSTTNMSSRVETSRNPENSRLWKVTLQLACKPSDNAQICPYLVDVELVGFFEVDQDFEESKIQDLVTCNAPALLFGAARELILLITGRGPFPAFTLPSVTFIDHSALNRRKLEDKASAAPSGKAA